MNNLGRKIFFCLMLVFFSFPFFVRAESYDIYVDKNYDGDEEGSSDKPFSSIDEALEKVSSLGKKIYVKNGTYEERITLSKGVELFGESKKQTIISGGTSGDTLTLNDDNSLKNLTIQGGNKAVYILGKAKISDCIIRDAKSIGINIFEKGGLVEISDSEIIKNGKGIYAQRGSYFKITNSQIENNNEEGIDIRDRTSGVISSNEISGNGEGGIELIVGGSEFLIKNNSIKKNKASGIALQFYSMAEKKGKIEIKNNVIASNGNNGVVCKAPSGGDYGKSYWDESIDLLENRIERNRLEGINSICRLTQAISEEEEKKNENIENQQISENNSEAEKLQEKTTEQIAEEEAMAQRLEKEKNMENVANEITVQKNQVAEEIGKKIEEIRNINKIKVFFIGPDYRKIQKVKDLLEKLRMEESRLVQVITEVGSLVNEEKKSFAVKTQEELKNFIESNSKTINEIEKKFSLFGWVRKLF